MKVITQLDKSTKVWKHNVLMDFEAIKNMKYILKRLLLS